jgi:hypothetical protein
MNLDDEERAHNTKGDKKSHDKGLSKKVYRKPQVFIYGNIREITQNVGNTGMMDGFFMFRTGF